jgi:hypothetical protein
MANQVELERLAGAVAKLRPEWTAKSVRTYLETHHADRAFADLAVALVAIAVDPKSKTPARISEHGPWWTAAYVASTDGTPAPRHPMCERHPDEPAGRCGRCAAEAVPAERRRTLLADLRAVVRSAR